MNGAGRWQILAVVCLALSGCATAVPPARLASAHETMCKHCNCLMPAGVDPEATCPVCTCGRKAHRCVRGR